MNTKHIGLLTLVSALLLPGLASANAAQDNDNSSACCLASEYRLPESRPRPTLAQAQAENQAEAGGKTQCQVPLGDIACCIGAEWKLDAR
jgi:hypothetical protein